MRLGHTAVHKGKRVLVILRDDTRIEDYFLERKPPYIWLKNYGRLHIGDIRSFKIFKGLNQPKNEDENRNI